MKIRTKTPARRCPLARAAGESGRRSRASVLGDDTDICIYILLSPDGQPPPSRVLAQSGARYKISDLPRFMARGDEAPRAHQGGCSSGGGR